MVRRVCIGLVLGAILLSLVPAPSQAVPAWTRRYGFGCTACHMGGTNRLTKLGQDFLVRGHRMSGDEGAYGKDASVKLTDYLSYASKVRFIAEKDVDPSTKFDIEALAIYAGGPFDANYSFFFEYYAHERGAAASNTGGTIATASRSKLADAYIQYAKDPAQSKYWYGRAGQIYPYLIYQASSGGRVTVDRPLAINANVGGGNQYTPRDRSYGLSFGLVDESKMRLEAGIINSGGTNARANLQEVNNFKDVFATAEWIFDTNGSSLGLYGYNGKFLTLPVSTTSEEDSFSRVGLLGQFVRPTYEVSGGAFLGHNGDPAGGRRKPKLYYLEVAHNLKPDLTVFARYDNQNNDLETALANAGGVSKANGATIGISKRLGKVGRFVSELNFRERTSIDTAGTGTTNSSTSVWMNEINWMF